MRDSAAARQRKTRKDCNLQKKFTEYHSRIKHLLYGWLKKGNLNKMWLTAPK